MVLVAVEKAQAAAPGAVLAAAKAAGVRVPALAEKHAPVWVLPVLAAV
jgi:hypothetical protein